MRSRAAVLAGRTSIAELKAVLACAFVALTALACAGLLSAAVAVTGTPACTEYGAQTATDLAADLTGAGRTVVTNTGFGIEAAAFGRLRRSKKRRGAFEA